MYLDKVKARFESVDVLRQEKVVPCTEEEVRGMEETLGFSLPAAYREFLLWMGHARGAGTFMSGTDCFYEWLPLIQGWAVDLLEECGDPEVLPEDAFVFSMHQGYQFNFMRISDGDNPPIYYYTEEVEPYRIVNGLKVYNLPGGRFVLTHQSLADFLDEQISNSIEIRSRWMKKSQLSWWYPDFGRWLTRFRQK